MRQLSLFVNNDVIYKNLTVDGGQNVGLVVSLWCFMVPHTDTSRRLVVFRVRLGELPVRLAVFRGRLIASWVRLVILSVRFVSWPLRLIVLRVRLIADHIGSSSFVVLPFRHFVMAFHRFDSSTQRGYNSMCITWSVIWFQSIIYHEYIMYLSIICSLPTENDSLKSLS